MKTRMKPLWNRLRQSPRLFLALALALLAVAILCIMELLPQNTDGWMYGVVTKVYIEEWPEYAAIGIECGLGSHILPVGKGTPIYDADGNRTDVFALVVGQKIQFDGETQVESVGEYTAPPNGGVTFINCYGIKILDE